MKKPLTALLLLLAILLDLAPASFALDLFEDVSNDDYFYPAVCWAYENGIAVGTSSSTFSPDDTCTRAQIVTFLWRYAGEPIEYPSYDPFEDISYSDYYYDAVMWAYESNIVFGTSETTFSPDEKCTRAQVATILWRFEDASDASGIMNPFTDISQKNYYYNAVLWAFKNGITVGTSDNTFSPEDGCTRAHIITFLFRFKEVDDIPISETKLSEVHTPNDTATYVTWNNWNSAYDMGITMQRYGGGIKVSVCDMFTDFGSNVAREKTSKLILSLYPANHTDTTFKGVIVLDKSMYGSATSGTIRMLVNNEEVFSTGEIDGYCETDFPFEIDITGINTIVIEADVVLRGSSFVYGIVDEL